MKRVSDTPTSASVDPRFEGLTRAEVAQLMMLCAKSDDQSDKEFAAAAREQIKRMKQ